MLEGVEVGATSEAQFALSQTGTLIYKTGGGASTSYEPVWVDRDGNSEATESGWTVTDVGARASLALSPDNTRLALTIGGASGTTDLWIKDLGTGTLTRFTTEGNSNIWPSWSADGDFLTFIRNDRIDPPMASSEILRARVDGTGVVDTVVHTDTLGLAEAGRGLFEAFFSPNGEWLVYRAGTNDGGLGQDIFGLRVGVDSVATPLLANPNFNEWGPALSPDGKWLAYAYNTGRPEVFVRPFPLIETGRWQVSTAGGANPAWAHSGRELFYQNPSGEMVAVEIETRPTFTPGRQSVLFPTDSFRYSASGRSFDVSRDDNRFVMLRSVSAGVPSKLILVQNFFEELKRLVPN